ncbi:MAG: hypothetical protein N2323_05725 [candidate division WOR-3 bacterium]|nr:hypothetical protein [candidate division WOR-3 bacterium]MCX7837432.1 hypothetical protein [candidate division WOR-3 bacterium]MDW8114132.1 hypothetical protein [candidate division WOR-3 bacterium]
MKKEILELIKRLYGREDKEGYFKKSPLLNFLNIEEIVESFQKESGSILWNEIMDIFEKINELRKKNKKSS